MIPSLHCPNQKETRNDHFDWICKILFIFIFFSFLLWILKNVISHYQLILNDIQMIEILWIYQCFIQNSEWVILSTRHFPIIIAERPWFFPFYSNNSLSKRSYGAHTINQCDCRVNRNSIGSTDFYTLRERLVNIFVNNFHCVII